jgi:hypothetical protein
VLLFSECGRVIQNIWQTSNTFTLLCPALPLATRPIPVGIFFFLSHYSSNQGPSIIKLKPSRLIAIGQTLYFNNLNVPAQQLSGCVCYIVYSDPARFTKR